VKYPTFLTKILILCCVLLTTSPAFAQKQTDNRKAKPAISEPVLTVIEKHAEELVVRFDYPLLTVDETSSGSVLHMGSLAKLPAVQAKLLPVHALVLPGKKRTLNLRVLEKETAVHVLTQPPVSYDGDHTLNEQNPVSSKQNITSPLKQFKWASIEELGQYRGIPCSRLQINTTRWDQRRGEVSYLRSITFSIRFDSQPESGYRPTVTPLMLQGLSGMLPLPVSTNDEYQQPQQTYSTNQAQLKMYISKKGLYHLSYQSLTSWGVSINGDPRTFSIMNRGDDIPIYVSGEADGRFDENDYIEFWAEDLHDTYSHINPEIYSDLYTDVNVYWLSWGGELGSRLVEESGEIVEIDPMKMVRPTTYQHTVHAEQNNYYNRLSHVDPDSLKEHWYYDIGIEAPSQSNYLVNLPDPDHNAIANADVRVSLMGLTYLVDPGNPEDNTGYHHAYVYLNDMTSPSGALQAGTGGISPWRGQTGVLLEATGSEGIRSSSLLDNNNTLSILCPGDTQSDADKILLNWFEITYPRLFKASSGYIHFTPPVNAGNNLIDYRLEEFATSQVDIYKIGQSKIINAEILPYIDNGITYYEVHFQDHSYGDCKYIAISPGAKLSPDSTELDPGSDIVNELSSGEAVKLLVIAHRDFENHPDLDNYIDRRNVGLGRTELVFIDDVFDELSYGIYTPQAIKDLMLSLPTPPEFLLLVGDASYYTRDIFEFGGNLIPAMYIQTRAYGAVASDFWYSRLDDDMIPDVAVGRISARTETELSIYLNKLEQYETSTSQGHWRNKHLFITGIGTVYGTTFLQVSQGVIQQIPDNVFIERLAVDPETSPFFGGTIDLIDLMDNGALVVDYNGHGAGQVWGDRSLFRLEHIQQLSNEGSYPFITNFTCFIGAFDNPEPSSILGEEFIFAEQKGAIATFGSSGFGWFFNGSWLQEELAGLFYDNPEMRLGEIVHAAKIAYYLYYGSGGSVESFDTVHLMNLLGDPSLKIAFPEIEETPLQVTPEFASTGNQIDLSLEGNYQNYDGYLRIYDESDYPLYQSEEPFEIPLLPSETSIGASFQLPAFNDSTDQTTGSYRISLWNPSNQESFSTSAPLYFLDAYSSGSVFDSLSTMPDLVDIWDSFYFKAKILDAQGVQSAWAHFVVEHVEIDTVITVVPHDSLEMLLAGQPNWYETTAPIGATMYPYEAGDRVTYWVKATDIQDSLSVSSEKVFYVMNRLPNPEWVTETLRMDIDDGVASFAIDVINMEPEDPAALGVDIDSVDVEFHWLTSDTTAQLIGSAIIKDLYLDSTATAYVPSPFSQPGYYPIEVRLNQQNWLIEDEITPSFIDTIAVDHFNVSSQSGTGDTLRLTSIIDIVEVILPGNIAVMDTTCLTAEVFLPPDTSGNEDGVIVFGQREGLTLPMTQSDISFALHNAQNTIKDGYGIEIDFLGDIASNQNSCWLSMGMTYYDTSIVIEDVAIHYNDPDQVPWIMTQDGSIELPQQPGMNFPAYSFFYEGSRRGYFSLLQNGDKVGPAVEISVDGQIYTDGGYVPSRPKISTIIQDAGGVNTEPSSYWIKVDGDSTKPGEITVSTAGDGQIMTLSYRPNSSFDVGMHNFMVRGEDLFGNADSSAIEFQVRGDFRLDFIGNYPNPFKNQTYFAYRLTEQTTEPIEIRIYTVSGRLIRILRSDSAEEINYGEIYWDGRDEDGENIANGVYFYKLKARRGDQEIERTMKLAKLR